jgi:DNA polymerase III alpha subunit
MSLVPLHLHSHWSLLDGVPSVGEIVEFAQASRLSALALTDTNAMYGTMEFVTACRQAGITPILGAEVTLTGGASLVLLAQTMSGYGNLCRLVTRLQAAPDREAALARGLGLADLAGHTEGVIALSGGRNGSLDANLRQGDLPQAESLAREMINLFGPDRFCIELQIIQEGDMEWVVALQGAGQPAARAHSRHARQPLPLACRRAALPRVDGNAQGLPAVRAAGAKRA